MKHALAVLAGIAVGLPGMAALASMNRHAMGGLPDRFVPWAQAGHRLRTGLAETRRPAPGHEHEHEHEHERARPASSPLAPFAEPGGGLRVSIDAPRSVRPGGTYTYRVRLANRGPGTPGEITVHNVLPAGVERTGTSLPGGAGGYAGGRDTTLVMPRLPPGSSATARFVVKVRPKAHGDLVARSRIATVGGVRAPRSSAARASTRIR